MKLINRFFVLLALVSLTATVGCNDDKSYAELLNDENMATNLFLVNQRVVSSVPADTVFEYGIDAPFYQLDEDGNMFMQVIFPGTKGNKAETDQLIYFRYMRYSLYNYSFDGSSDHPNGYYGSFSSGEGNDADLSYGSASFRYNNYTSQTSYQWGEGIQMPLNFLPLDCEVNLVIKSQLGVYSEQSYVIPYFYRNVRYFPSQM